MNLKDGMKVVLKPFDSIEGEIDSGGDIRTSKGNLVVKSWYEKYEGKILTISFYQHTHYWGVDLRADGCPRFPEEAFLPYTTKFKRRKNE